jgi:hypothetical protein
LIQCFGRSKLKYCVITLFCAIDPEVTILFT